MRYNKALEEAKAVDEIKDEKPVKEIRNDKGQVVVRLHGEPNIEALARALLGMKQA
ncbi:hypothetical protein [Peribacillus frigoritolerans]|uniref:hypothetical protein n=1 Tax=Peribacillus frigoritolerans TaxID=450367 RepID=UPI0013A5F144|nr:hypothetical protein [Peribacillus frigoritolerans]